MAKENETPWSGKVPIRAIATLENPVRRKTVVVVPGSDAPLLDIEIPEGLSGSARERVANRHLQDQAGLKNDSVEVRPFEMAAERGKWTRAVVVEKNLADRWREKAGTSCRSLLPDYLALPVAPDIWTLYFDGKSVMARLGLEDAFSAEREMALPQIEIALGRAAPKAVLKLSELPEEIENLLSGAHIKIFTKATEAKRAGLNVPNFLAHGEEKMDLRKDPRAARDRVRRRVLPWIWPLGISVIGAAVWAGALWLETEKLRDQTETLRAEAREITRDVFVPQGPILDPRTQIMRELLRLESNVNASRSKVSPLDLFSQVISVLRDSPAKIQSSAIVDGAALVVGAELQNFADLDTTVELISGNGLAAEIKRSEFDSVDQVVNAELAISFVSRQGAGE